MRHYASTVFMQREAPTYRTGLWAVTGAQLYSIVLTVSMVYYHYRQNKKANRGEVIWRGWRISGTPTKSKRLRNFIRKTTACLRIIGLIRVDLSGTLVAICLLRLEYN